jgi:hypothetical protein
MRETVQWREPSEEEERVAQRYKDVGTFFDVLNLANPDHVPGSNNDTEPLTKIICDPAARATLSEEDWRRFAALIESLQKRARGGQVGGRTTGEHYDAVRAAAEWVKAERNSWIMQHPGRKRTPRGMRDKLIADAAAKFNVTKDMIQSELKN